MTIANDERTELLDRARSSIEAGLTSGKLEPAPPTRSSLLQEGSSLQELRATFVTLTLDHDLRGCCGSIEPRFALADDVWRNAWASAFADPRFPPLTRSEQARMNVHISVLSPLEPFAASSEQDLLARLRPGRDGLLIQLGAARATFLPVVWETLDDPVQFLSHLKQKAGWRVDFWSPDIEIWRYETESFGED
jgi:AmmeMemoRadiSam system protein A